MQQQPGQNMAQTPVQVPVLSKQQQQTQGGHTAFHHLNHQKTFNVVSLLKSTNAPHPLSNQQKQQQQQTSHHHPSQQQQPQSHPHPQTFSNILSRSHTPSGPTVSSSTQPQPILCQLSTPEGGGNNLYAINPRIVNNISIDANGSPNTGGSGGIVGLNVGCIDNRKYDYKNKILNNNLSAQEYNPSGSGLGAGNANMRANPQAAPIYRGPAPSSAARSSAGSRHMPNVSMPTMFPPAMPQSMIMQNFQHYPPRQTNPFPTHPFTFQQTLPPQYYPIQFFHPGQLPPQAQTHQRAAVGVTTNASVGNALSAGPNGPLAGPSGPSPAQVSMAAGSVISNAVPAPGPVLSVAATNTAAQVGVGVSSMVAVVPPVATQQPAQPTKRRAHALAIIDPNTNKNILDEMENSKRSSNSESEYQEPVPASAPVKMQPDTSLPYTLGVQQQQKNDFSNIGNVGSVIVMTSADSTSRTNLAQHPGNIDMHHIQQHREIGQIGQTPVVSAMSDAPSIEILPSQPKSRSKKIPIVAPKDEDDAQNSNDKHRFEASPADPEPIPPQQQSEEPIKDSGSDATIETDSSPTIDLADEQNTANSEDLAVQRIENEICSEAETKKEALDMQTGAVGEEQALTNAGNTMAASINAVEEAADDCINTQVVSKARNEQKDTTLPLEGSISSFKAAVSDNTDETLPSIGITHENKASMRNGNLAKQESAACDETDRALITGVPPSVEASRRDSIEKITEDNVSVPLSAAAALEPSGNENEDGLSNLETGNSQTQSNAKSLIQYNEGQWSPNNPSGKKQYDRVQLLQLREAKASRIQPDVSNSAILPQCNLMPTFARNSGNTKRMQSMVGMGSGHRDGGGSGSGNYGSKQSSMLGVNSRGSAKGGMIHVNLSLNQDVKLNENDNAWRPRMLQKGDEQEDPDVKAVREKEELLRQVRGILNKLTPEKFDALVEEIIKLKIDTKEKMEAVMILVFEKAVDEPNFSVSYARLCHRLIAEVKANEDERMESGTKSNLASFRNALLDKTEREFTVNVTQNTAKQTKLQPIIEKIKTCTDPAEKAELESQLEEEELKVRRRSTGTVRFIGELFKISMLTGKIIYSCIEQLLNPHNEDMLECLCKLLTTVGAKLEQTPTNPKDPIKMYSLEKVIGRMQAIASKTDKDSNKVSSRVRFMLQDVIDLRKNKWQSKRNEAPKTMGQIEKEAKSEQMSSQFLTYSGSLSTGPSSGVGGGNIGGGGGKRGGDDRGNRYNEHRSGYSGSHSQRGGESGRRQNMGANNSGNSGGNANGGSNSDDTWHVQTARGRSSVYVDSNKLDLINLGLMNFNQDVGTKKMGGMTQFIWNKGQTAASSQTNSATTPSNSFAALSSLDDRGSINDRDRDRSGPRNKGSYNKNSNEPERREHWNDRNRISRTGSSQASRENSSSRGGPQSAGVRSMNTPSAMSKSASHSSSKYTQPSMASAPSSTNRMVGKPSTGFAASESVKRTLSTGLPASQSNSSSPIVFEESTDSDLKTIKSVINEMIETILLTHISPKSIAEAAKCIDSVKNSQKCGFLYYILTDYLHSRYVGPSFRRNLGIIVSHLIETKVLSVQHFTVAYEQFADIASDLLVDIPELWTYIFQFTGPLISKQLITVHDLWTDRLRNDDSSNLGERFLKAFLNYCTREIGPRFTRNMWLKQQLKWTDFLSAAEAGSFIAANKFEYIENETAKHFIDVRSENKEAHYNQVVDHVKHLLHEGANADSIIDYISGNIVCSDKQFIQNLTTKICEFAVDTKEGKLDVIKFQKVCIPVLQRYIELMEERELECLYAMQLYVHSLEHPRGLLCELFAQLYDNDVITPESFLKWRNSNDQSAGKGVAVKGLNSFFNQLQEETSDENN